VSKGPRPPGQPHVRPKVVLPEHGAPESAASPCAQPLDLSFSAAEGESVSVGAMVALVLHEGRLVVVSGNRRIGEIAAGSPDDRRIRSCLEHGWFFVGELVSLRERSAVAHVAGAHL